MSESKYRYNVQTLSYEKVDKTTKDRIVRILSLIVSGIIFSAVALLISYAYIDSPKEKQLLRENEQLTLQYDLLQKRTSDLSEVLQNIQNRDDNIYRVIFEAEPIPENIRKSGLGGVNRYKHLENINNSELVIESTKRIDLLEKQLYVQSKSFDEVYEMAKQKEKMLASIPAIQPVSNKELKRMASGYGHRIHPIYKTRKFHAGMDFTAPTGTDVYATGNGKVISVKRSRRGFGNHIVIDHGYGYETVYAHMNEFNVRKGQNIKRGEIIGYVGSTGTSTAPHLHYEVHKNGKAVNPVNFYFNDLDPEQYDAMINLSSAANQSFD
jgi:murein DD-endopeptidase MepM/ murein hydrolase activator NlpD